ncbi:MAG TPA: glycolate oxidase subunit GlcF [Burkholderiaceae bacterium]|nr:glycolate oxidase subunit GlcF [Burkholderiaceae bacterium]
MQTSLASWIRDTTDGREAEAILRTCVHCGFCNATCPTYQLLGNELDGPRGRIYLIKQVLEGKPATAATQLHLDRCLTCRNCETTCPSGVQYSHLLDIGRRVVEKKVVRPMAAAATRAALREGLTSNAFAPAFRLGQVLRPFLPATLRSKVPPLATARTRGAARRAHPRRMLYLAGCVQPAMQPNINAATERVFDALGVQLTAADGAGCCGAIRHHLADLEGARADARRNIDAWWPQLQSGVEAIVMNASGCGATVREYDHLLREDPRYAEKAARIVAATKDVAEVVPGLVEQAAPRMGPVEMRRVAFHPPCTLQHAQKIRGVVESMLRAVGADVVGFEEAHLCCGSAGTYSVLQPELAGRLRDRKLERIEVARPDVILSANIGCISHLQGGSARPVMHWIEWLDRALAPA